MITIGDYVSSFSLEFYPQRGCFRWILWVCPGQHWLWNGPHIYRPPRCWSHEWWWWWGYSTTGHGSFTGRLRKIGHHFLSFFVCTGDSNQSSHWTISPDFFIWRQGFAKSLNGWAWICNPPTPDSQSVGITSLCYYAQPDSSSFIPLGTLVGLWCFSLLFEFFKCNHVKRKLHSWLILFGVWLESLVLRGVMTAIRGPEAPGNGEQNSSSCWEFPLSLF